MAKVPLQKIRITGLRQHYKILLQELHRKGILQLVENEKFREASSDAPTPNHFDAFDLARIDFALRYLSPHAPKKGKLENILTGGKLIMPEEVAKKRFAAFAPQLESVVSECEKLEESSVRVRNELQQLQQKKEKAGSFFRFSLPINTPLETERTRSWVGSVPVAKRDAFIEALAKTSHLLDLEEFSTAEKQVFLRLTVLNEVTPRLPELFQRFGFQEFDLASEFEAFGEKTPAQILERIEAEQKRLAKELTHNKTRIEALAKHTEDLKITRDFHHWYKDKNDAEKHMFRSQRVFAFEAWIPKFRLKKLNHWIEQTFLGDVAVEAIEPNKKESPPTLLHNKSGISSFQMITEMFGSPREKEIDPTPGMAPFFIIFFGVCLSDTGYGLLLFLITSLLLLFGKHSKQARRVIWMIFLLGISATAGGILLGGHFGMTVDQAPAFLTTVNAAGDLVFRGQILDPMSGSGALSFLVFTFAVGIFQLLMGLVMQFLQNLHNRDYVSAFADSVAWFYFLVSLLLWALADQFGFDKQLLSYFALSGAGILVLTQGRKKKNIVLKLLFGILGLYGIMDYVSSMLSYSRLMALGLATGIIGSAMNMTAIVLGDMLPGILGILVLVLFLLFGHSINFALSMLGAFVHTMRLQFIEFFGRFYGGGAQQFKAFARVKKYLLFRS
ncbi:MAG: hypothetical protein K9M51_00980 [Candidatus Gracilibacteria bacterium]|nr:hypothetical protein [Candidatus Gracilibacteria bacterium]